MIQMQEKRRELNKRQSRMRILKSARTLFSAEGYEETTMEDVARYAEVSRATLYNYFPSKESLLTGIAEDEMDTISHLIDVELQSEPQYLLKLLAVMESFVFDIASYIALARRITYLNSCPDSILYGIRLRMLHIVHDLVEGAQQQGDIRTDVPVEDLVHMVLGVCLTAQFEWTNIAEYTQEYCGSKLRRFFYYMLAGVLTEAGRQRIM